MRPYALIVLLLAYATPCVAQEPPPELPADERIKLLPYNDTDIYTITTKYGYQTNIVFSPTEEIGTISVGDRSLWQIIPAGNRLFIRPMQEGSSTNMTVLTNKRSYLFDLKSVGEDESDEKNIYVAKFIYPGDKRYAAYMSPPPVVNVMPPPVAAQEPPPPAAQTVTAPEPSPVASSPPKVSEPIYPNYNYTYSGPDTLAPLQVFDNGKTTFFKYHTVPKTLPDVYVIDTAGHSTAIKPDVQNNMLIVPTVVGTLALKSAQGTIVVYNEMLNPEKPL